MTEHALLGPWIRRFLLEYLVGERNLAINTRRSYRDMLVLLVPRPTTKVPPADGTKARRPDTSGTATSFPRLPPSDQ